MRNTIFGAAALALLAASAPSFAGTGFEPGLYVGVDGARASVSNKYADSSNDISLGAATGYQFTPNFGFEVYTRTLSFNPFRGFLSEAGYYPDRHYGIAAGRALQRVWPRGYRPHDHEGHPHHPGRPHRHRCRRRHRRALRIQPELFPEPGRHLPQQE